MEPGIVEKMEPDLGKLFIGGISWETDETRLREHFSTFGEVVEAEIIRDRTTGRARGFGFIVFADPAVVERVVIEKHMIDGRAVEAKRAVPKNDQQMPSRSNSSIQESQGTGGTKKIFVGGLASTITENDFKAYFSQYGTISDAVVMYDQHTRRPRGFGFITYESEDAVDRVLYKTFHELNGKKVEVKRAVPKDQSTGSNRSSMVGSNLGFHRTNSIINNYAQGYNLNIPGTYGVRMAGGFNPIGGGRAGVSQLGSAGYPMGVNMDPRLNPSFGGSSNFSSNFGYGQVLNPYYSGNPNRFSTPIGFGGGNGWTNSFQNSLSRNVGGNVVMNNAGNAVSRGTFLRSGNGNFGPIGNSGANWGSYISAQGAGRGTVGYGVGESNFALGGGVLGRNSIPGALTSSSGASVGGPVGSHVPLHRAGSLYDDPTWGYAASQLDDPSSLGYVTDNAADFSVRTSEDYVEGHDIADR